MGNEAAVRITGEDRKYIRGYEGDPWQVNSEVRYSFDGDKPDGQLSPNEALRLLQDASGKIKQLIPDRVWQREWPDWVVSDCYFEIPANEGGGRLRGHDVEELASRCQVRLQFDYGSHYKIVYQLDGARTNFEFSAREARSLIESVRTFMGEINTGREEPYQLEKARFTISEEEGQEILDWNMFQARARGIKPSSPMGASLKNPWCALGELGPNLDVARLQANRLEYIARSALFGFELGPTTEAFFNRVIPDVAKMQLDKLLDAAPAPRLEVVNDEGDVGGYGKAMTCAGVPNRGKYWFGCHPTPLNQFEANEEDRKHIRVNGAMTAGDRPPASPEGFGRVQGKIELFHIGTGLIALFIGKIFAFKVEGDVEFDSLPGWRVLNIADALQRSFTLIAREAAKRKGDQPVTDVSEDILHTLRSSIPKTMATLESFLGINLTAKWVNNHPDGRGAYLDLSLQVEVKRDKLKSHPKLKAFDKYWEDVGDLVSFEGALRNPDIRDGDRRVNSSGRNLVSIRFKSEESEGSNPVVELKFHARDGSLIPHQLKKSPRGKIELGQTTQPAGGRSFSLRNQPPFFYGSAPRTVTVEFDQMFIDPDILPNLTVRDLVFDLKMNGSNRGRSVEVQLHTDGYYRQAKGAWEQGGDISTFQSPGKMAWIADKAIPGTIVDHARAFVRELRTASVELGYQEEGRRNKVTVEGGATAPDNALVTYMAKVMGDELVPEEEEAEVMLTVFQDLFRALSSDYRTQTAGLICEPR